MARKPIYVAIDLETTGTKPKLHAILQVAVVFPNGDTYSSDVCPDLGTYCVDPGALRVNHFTAERWEVAPTMEKVDAELAAWLDPKFNSRYEYLVPIGWNPGSFDVQFIEQHMPLTAKLLSYHTVDLNAVLYTMSEAFGVAFLTFKDKAKAQAVAALGSSLEHDAVWDSKAALASWRYIVKGLRKLRDGRRDNLVAAVRELYYAARWTPDRDVANSAELWARVRDAAGFEPGHSPGPLVAGEGVGVIETENVA